MTPWTIARQAPLFMGFPRQEYWSGLPFPSPGDLPDPGIKTISSAPQMDSLLLSHQESPYICNLLMRLRFDLVRWELQEGYYCNLYKYIKAIFYATLNYKHLKSGPFLVALFEMTRSLLQLKKKPQKSILANDCVNCVILVSF